MKWAKRLHEVKLDKYGYVGEVLSLWVNFPRAVKDQLFKVIGEDKILDCILEHGIIDSCSLDPDPKDLPWDVHAIAVQEMSAEVTRINAAIYAAADDGKDSKPPVSQPEDAKG